MYTNMFGIMAICENIIYNNKKQPKEDWDMANSIRKRIIENRKLTKKQCDFIKERM